MPHLRLGRTGRVLESLIAAVIEQRVAGKDAFEHGGCWSPSSARPPWQRLRACASLRLLVWRRIPSWEFHLANVDPAGRARLSAVRSGRTRWSSSSRPAEQARTALTSLPGVGIWTAAETVQRAFGDADALSIGDYHLAKVVG